VLRRGFLPCCSRAPFCAKLRPRPAPTTLNRRDNLLVELGIDTVVCLTLAKWEAVSGQFGGYLMALIAQIAFMSMLLVLDAQPTAQAAEPMTLALECAGTLTVNNFPAVSASKGIIVDFTERTVKGFGTPIDKVELSSVNEALITFGGPNTDRGWTTQGSIDRVTGDLEAMGTLWGPHGIVGVMVYLLKCKPTQRIF
jgi:hypothetical protein